MEVLRRGSTGPIVEYLQSLLQSLSFYSGRIDGIFGANTENAVKAFQRSNRLTADGIVGKDTWAKLQPYIDGASGKIVPTNISYNYDILRLNISSLKKKYPFIKMGIIGSSVLGKNLYYLKIGNGSKEVFYNGSFHANEWITTPILMRFVEDYSDAISKGETIYRYNAKNLFDKVTLYIVPMVNPDGVDLVTGNVRPNTSIYNNYQTLANNYPQIPFPSGWKANFNGVDLNLQFPAGWENAREIKYRQGYTMPGPRDFVGYGPLDQRESFAVYNFTLAHDFQLILAYHTQGEVIYWRFLDMLPPRSYYIGERFSNASGYFLEDTPYSSGFAGYKDWFIQDYNRPGYTIEAGRGENPLPISDFDQIYNDNIGILAMGMALI